MDATQLRAAMDQAAADRNERLLAEGKVLMLIISPETEQKMKMMLKGMEMVGFPVSKMRESILQDAFIAGMNSTLEDLLSAIREARASASSVEDDTEELFNNLEAEMNDRNTYRRAVEAARKRCKRFREYGPAACCSGCNDMDCPSFMADR
jgi:hypothetical protein